MTSTKPRKFKGFGVVTREGCYLWGYSRPTEVETREAYERHNPQVDGHDSYRLVKLAVLLEELE